MSEINGENDQYSDEFTTFVISRRIEASPARSRFLEKVHELGRLAFPSDRDAILPATVLTQAEREELMQDDDGFGVPIVSQVGVTVSRLEEYRRLELPLLERAVPRELNYAGRFAWATGQLQSGDRGTRAVARQDNSGNARRRHSHTINEELARTGLPYDGYAEQATLNFVDVTWAGNAYRGFREMVLVPDAEDPLVMKWVDQAEVCFRALATLAKKTAYPTQSIMPGVAFARVPTNATVQERQRFVHSMREILPVSLPLGPIRMKTYHKAHLGS
ncbi:MAG: hypothetical protein WC498_00465 [Candidatus Saccharimonadales bacterium]